MTEDLYINNKAAFATWGLELDESSYDALLLPAPQKPAIENKSSGQHGKQIMPSAYIDERTVSIVVRINANSRVDYLSKLNSLMTELRGGIIAFRVISLNTVYYLAYESSFELSIAYGMKSGRHSIRFSEPNPNDRDLA